MLLIGHSFIFVLPSLFYLNIHFSPRNLLVLAATARRVPIVLLSFVTVFEDKFRGPGRTRFGRRTRAANRRETQLISSQHVYVVLPAPFSVRRVRELQNTCSAVRAWLVFRSLIARSRVVLDANCPAGGMRTSSAIVPPSPGGGTVFRNPDRLIVRK